MPFTAVRLPRFRRVPDALSIRLTPRDHEIMGHVFRHRFLRSTHLVALVTGSPQHVLRRLQRLFHHGYLDRPRAQIERYTTGSKAMVYGVGTQGIKLLEERLGIPRRRLDWTARNRSVNRYFLDHALAVADILVKLEVACRAGGHTQLIHPRQPHEPSIHWKVTIHHRDSPATVGVVPDAVFGLRTPGQPDAWFFLEADRATMPVVRRSLSQTSLLRKMVAYHETWRQKVLAGTLPRFRVLVATSTPQRSSHILDAYREIGQGRGTGLLLFTDHRRLLDCEDPLHEPVVSNGHGDAVVLTE